MLAHVLGKQNEVLLSWSLHGPWASVMAHLGLPCTRIPVSICLFPWTVSPEGRGIYSSLHLSLSHVSLCLSGSPAHCRSVVPILSLSSILPSIWPFLLAPCLPTPPLPLHQPGKLALCWIHEGDPPRVGALEPQGQSPSAPGSAACSVTSGSLTVGLRVIHRDRSPRAAFL